MRLYVGVFFSNIGMGSETRWCDLDFAATSFAQTCHKHEARVQAEHSYEHPQYNLAPCALVINLRAVEHLSFPKKKASKKQTFHQATCKRENFPPVDKHSIYVTAGTDVQITEKTSGEKRWWHAKQFKGRVLACDGAIYVATNADIHAFHNDLSFLYTTSLPMRAEKLLTHNDRLYAISTCSLKYYQDRGCSMVIALRAPSLLPCFELRPYRPFPCALAASTEELYVAVMNIGWWDAVVVAHDTQDGTPLRTCRVFESQVPGLVVTSAGQLVIAHARKRERYSRRAKSYWTRFLTCARPDTLAEEFTYCVDDYDRFVHIAHDASTDQVVCLTRDGQVAHFNADLRRGRKRRNMTRAR